MIRHCAEGPKVGNRVSGERLTLLGMGWADWPRSRRILK